MLKQRVLTALVLVGGLLGLLFAAPPLLAHIAFAGLASIGAWEWSTLLRAPLPMRVGYSALVALACAALALSDPSVAVVVWSAATVFWLALVPLWLAGRWTLLKTPLLGHALGLLLLVATWAALVELLKRGPWALLGILAIVWVADIAAYFFGRAFGKHKLAPSISPGKTWEGAAGAFLGVTAYGLIVGPALGVWVSLPPLAVLGLAILTGVSIIGDLFESLLKRQAGLKDSGSIFPGHGGVLDRIDSVMSSLPVVVLALHVLSAHS